MTSAVSHVAVNTVVKHFSSGFPVVPARSALMMAIRTVLHRFYRMLTVLSVFSMAVNVSFRCFVLNMLQGSYKLTGVRPNRAKLMRV